MAAMSLTPWDLNVLKKIQDPESDPSTSIDIDDSLPKDPHVRDSSEYAQVVAAEREIILAMQKLEMELAGFKPRSITDPVVEYKECVRKLGNLISDHPNYASARNNRAQALRRLYGDGMLMANSPGTPKPLIANPEQAEKVGAASQCLADLDESIFLLTPASSRTAMSPVAAKTLSLAHTQRAAVYHFTSKLFASNALEVDADRRETYWSRLDFEEAASHDFAMGGRYGNDIAKGLAVSTNPTAKLCGQIVQGAMKREYGPDFVN